MAASLSEYYNVNLTRGRFMKLYSEEEKRVLEASRMELDVAAGITLIKKNSRPHSLFCLKHGSVSWLKADNREIKIDRKDIFLGTYTLLSEDRYSNSAVTMEPCKFYVYPREVVVNVFSYNSARPVWLLKRIAKELNNMEFQVQSTDLLIKKKVYNYLYTYPGQLDKRSGKYYIQLNVKELADFISVTKEDLLPILEEMAVQQMASLVGNRFIFQNSINHTIISASS